MEKLEAWLLRCRSAMGICSVDAGGHAHETPALITDRDLCSRQATLDDLGQSDPCIGCGRRGASEDDGRLEKKRNPDMMSDNRS